MAESEYDPQDDQASEHDSESESGERPLSGRKKAEKLFFEMIKDCGTDIIRMPSSCQVYLSRYLANFPEEADLLMGVLRNEMPTRLLQHESKAGYTDFLNDEIKRYARKSKVGLQDARWAADCWAEAIGRPRGYRPSMVTITTEDLYPDTEEKQKYENFVKAAMIFIVGGGGFFGTFVAISIIPIFMWALDGSIMALTAGQGGGGMLDQDNDLAIFLVAFIVAAGFGLVSAAAAIVAWIFAGGEEEPWATASVASGAGFTTVFICLGITMMCCIPPIFLPFVQIGCVFVATYKSAARGGNY